MTPLILVTLCSDAPLVAQRAAALVTVFRAQDGRPAR